MFEITRDIVLQSLLQNCLTQNCRTANFVPGFIWFLCQQWYTTIQKNSASVTTPPVSPALFKSGRNKFLLLVDRLYTVQCVVRYCIFKYIHSVDHENTYKLIIGFQYIEFFSDTGTLLFGGSVKSQTIIFKLIVKWSFWVHIENYLEWPLRTWNLQYLYQLWN